MKLTSRGVSSSLTIVAVISAVALGHLRDETRERQEQAQRRQELAGALREALGMLREYQSASVRAPRLSADGDTLYYTIPQRVALHPQPASANSGRRALCQLETPGDIQRVWLDSLCAGPGLPVGKGGLVMTAASETGSAWMLHRLQLYVDKENGGLWLRRSTEHVSDSLLIPLIRQLRAVPDHAGGKLIGYSLELSAVCASGGEVALRRNLCRYVVLDRRSLG